MNHLVSILVVALVVVLAFLAIRRRLRHGAPCSCGENCSSCHLCHLKDEKTGASVSSQTIQQKGK